MPVQEHGRKAKATSATWQAPVLTQGQAAHRRFSGDGWRTGDLCAVAFEDRVTSGDRRTWFRAGGGWNMAGCMAGAQPSSAFCHCLIVSIFGYYKFGVHGQGAEDRPLRMLRCKV